MAWCENAIYVDMLFIRCTEEKIYAVCVAGIVMGNSCLADDPLVTIHLTMWPSRVLIIFFLS